MADRILVALEDDWELMGNGSGDVAALQYLPARRLMDAAAPLGVPITFMVDVQQQLTWLGHDEPGLRAQTGLWRDTVRLMVARGHDVQLHIHPQWRGARRRGGHWQVDPRWSLGQWPDAERDTMIREAVAHLRDLVQTVDGRRAIRVFKAGSWGLQPSGGVLRDLRRHGLRLVLGVREGMVHPKLGIDTRGLEEPARPYVPDPDDLRRVARRPWDQVIVPLTPYKPSLPELLLLGVDRLRRRTSRRPDPPPNGGAERPFTSPRGLRAALGYTTHLKLGNQPLAYLLRQWTSCLRRAERVEAPLVVLVIESHTKQLGGNGRAAAGLLRRLARDRDAGRVELVDLTGVLDILDATPGAVVGPHGVSAPAAATATH